MGNVKDTPKPLTLEEALAKISEQEASISSLEEKATKDAETIAELESAVEESAAAYAELAKKLDASEVKSEPLTFEYGSVKRKFTIPKFNLEGVDYTAEEALENEELLEKLVKMSFGGFEIVNE